MSLWSLIFRRMLARRETKPLLSPRQLFAGESDPPPPPPPPPTAQINCLSQRSERERERECAPPRDRSEERGAFCRVTSFPCFFLLKEGSYTMKENAEQTIKGGPGGVQTASKSVFFFSLRFHLAVSSLSLFRIVVVVFFPAPFLSLFPLAKNEFFPIPLLPLLLSLLA